MFVPHRVSRQPAVSACAKHCGTSLMEFLPLHSALCYRAPTVVLGITDSAFQFSNNSRFPLPWIFLSAIIWESFFLSGYRNSYRKLHLKGWENAVWKSINLKNMQGQINTYLLINILDQKKAHSGSWKGCHVWHEFYETNTMTDMFASTCGHM